MALCHMLREVLCSDATSPELVYPVHSNTSISRVRVSDNRDENHSNIYQLYLMEATQAN